MGLKVKIGVLLGAAGLLLAGCASGGLSYPSTSGIDTMAQKTLSRSEQKAVIDDLQAEPEGAPNETPLIKATTSALPGQVPD